MAQDFKDELTWITNPDEVITLANNSRTNYILDLRTGMVRLDAGRRMRTLRSILDIVQVKKLIDAGDLAIVEER